MSMIGHVRQITPDELQKLQANPKATRELIRGGTEPDVTNIVAALERVQKIALRAEGTPLAKDPTEREKARAEILRELESTGVRLPGEEPGEEGLSLEKSWHSLHYLLTGRADEAPSPLGNVILGGTPIGDDLGYGPARYLSPGQVQEVASVLHMVKAEDLAERFDPPTMLKANIYACHDEDDLEMAQYYFADLVRYYEDAAVKGNAMLLYID